MIRSVGRGGGTPERSRPPKSGKIVVENGCYLPGVYTFGEAEIPEILVKLGKKSIFHRNFDKKSQNFLKIFNVFLHFWSKRENYAGRLINFRCLMEIIQEMWFS